MTRMLVDKDLHVAMRDGVQLATDVYRPDTRDPVPALVQRMPYEKDAGATVDFAIDVRRAAAAGYAVVVQSVRGRGRSQGRFTPFADEGPDGVDTAAWAAAQPWCSGRLALVGGSYPGVAAWLGARDGAEAQAIATSFTAPDPHDGWVYQSGVFQLGFVLLWALRHLAPPELVRLPGPEPARLAPLLRAAIDDIESRYGTLPLRQSIEGFEDLIPYVADWLGRPPADPSWQAVRVSGRYGDIALPGMHIGGWFDVFGGGTVRAYDGMRASSGRPQRLVMGPWAHGVVGGEFPERRFGVASGTAAFDVTGAQLRWFDHVLKGAPEPADPPVSLFVMGRNAWRGATAWPLPEAEPTALYLRGGGRANGPDGDGGLSAAAPGDEPPDRYRSDPADPVPTVGGATFLPGMHVAANAGPRRQHAVAARSDVLAYTSEPLATPLEIAGPVELVLYVSSDAPDTDVVAKLVDVAPDGSAFNVAEGVLRARYRRSPAEPAPLRPGTVHQLRVELGGTANHFLAGHRLRLLIAGSDFPRLARNPHTGRDDVAPGERPRVAHITVHHRAGAASHLLLPVVPLT